VIYKATQSLYWGEIINLCLLDTKGDH
jgi:hypothetical protein